MGQFLPINRKEMEEKRTKTEKLITTIIPAETGEGHMSTICVLTVPGLELKQLQRSL